MPRSAVISLLVAVTALLLPDPLVGQSTPAQNEAWQWRPVQQSTPESNQIPPPPAAPSTMAPVQAPVFPGQPGPPGLPPQGVPPVPPPLPVPVQVAPIPDSATVVPADQQPGFFTAFQISVLFPHLNGHLAGTVPVNGIARIVDLPLADLNWTGSPRPQVGYRLPDGAGSIQASYRSIVSDGTMNIDRFNGTDSAFLKTRLNFNAGDITYATPFMDVDGLWTMKWDLGVRIAGIYFDSQASGVMMQQRATSNFVGAGPSFGFDVHRRIADHPHLSLFGRIEGAVVLGEVHQTFGIAEQLPGGASTGGASDFSESQSVPVFGLELGVSYTRPDHARLFRFSFGYQFEQWWDVGSVGASSADLRYQGLFFRGEFKY